MLSKKPQLTPTAESWAAFPSRSHHTPFSKVQFSNSCTGSANTASNYGARLPGRFYLLRLTHQQPTLL